MQRIAALEAQQCLWNIALRVEERSLTPQKLHDQRVRRSRLTGKSAQTQSGVQSSHIDTVLQGHRKTVQTAKRGTVRGKAANQNTNHANK
jgi:hypothetical protein